MKKFIFITVTYKKIFSIFPCLLILIKVITFKLQCVVQKQGLNNKNFIPQKLIIIPETKAFKMMRIQKQINLLSSLLELVLQFRLLHNSELLTSLRTIRKDVKQMIKNSKYEVGILQILTPKDIFSKKTLLENSFKKLSTFSESGKVILIIQCLNTLDNTILNEQKWEFQLLGLQRETMEGIFTTQFNGKPVTQIIDFLLTNLFCNSINSYKNNNSKWILKDHIWVGNQIFDHDATFNKIQSREIWGLFNERKSGLQITYSSNCEKYFQGSRSEENVLCAPRKNSSTSTYGSTSSLKVCEFYDENLDIYVLRNQESPELTCINEEEDQQIFQELTLEDSYTQSTFFSETLLLLKELLQVENTSSSNIFQ